MRMSEGVEWAAHCAVILAALPDGAVLPAARLAEYHDLPAPYLAKSLQALAGAGIVRSTPGRTGGYRLARPAPEITLLEIVLAIDGDEPLFRCTEVRRRGPVGSAVDRFTPVCGIAAAMADAETAWRDQLAATTVADLAGGVPRRTPDVEVISEQWMDGAIRRRR